MITLSQIAKVYRTAAGELPVLAGVDLRIERRDCLSIVGPSGCGKSTLLHILGLLDAPTGGTMEFDGVRPWELGEAAQARFRNEKIGYIFQDHCLLPQCTVRENVLTPTLVGKADAGAAERAGELLRRVGLGGRLGHRPAELSGGEKQRVAIARALIRQPELLLCDEPTGNLDEKTAGEVIDLLLELQQDSGMMLVVVTHSAALAGRMERRYRMAGRRLEEVAG
ncbi:MAG: ABC transporter ATP-binding protein [Acidobacteria bacterium]|nr:ABC transporter ATP-binding protein [Bryobacteraceae bacterium CoA2 C42]